MNTHSMILEGHRQPQYCQRLLFKLTQRSLNNSERSDVNKFLWWLIFKNISTVEFLLYEFFHRSRITKHMVYYMQTINVLLLGGEKPMLAMLYVWQNSTHILWETFSTRFTTCNSLGKQENTAFPSQRENKNGRWSRSFLVVLPYQPWPLLSHKT